jgi:glycerol-1-phosphate dehydrogenase [NAD(P)+]
MLTTKQLAIPSLVRVKPGALDRMGIYAGRHHFKQVVILFSDGLKADLLGQLDDALRTSEIEVVGRFAVNSLEFAAAATLFHQFPSSVNAVIGFGGGKALDVAKYVAFLGKIPYLAVPTSLSNDGFCSPQSSLTVEGERRSLPAAVPFGVIIDTTVCLHAPPALWYSGVGDLVSKFTAIADWKLAFHAVGELVDDFAALLSDASIYQFLARPERDLEGMRVLGTALFLNGVAMSICGSSRPASGSEHLISHALDAISVRPRLHGLQVGLASYVISQLQGQHVEEIRSLLDRIKFWEEIAKDPFDREEWRQAVRLAPGMKTNFYTVLSERDCLPEMERILEVDERVGRCFGGERTRG